jgi:hypothetical protein
LFGYVLRATGSIGVGTACVEDLVAASYVLVAPATVVRHCRGGNKDAHPERNRSQGRDNRFPSHRRETPMSVPRFTNLYPNIGARSPPLLPSIWLSRDFVSPVLSSAVASPSNQRGPSATSTDRASPPR